MTSVWWYCRLRNPLDERWWLHPQFRGVLNDKVDANGVMPTVWCHWWSGFGLQSFIRPKKNPKQVKQEIILQLINDFPNIEQSCWWHPQRVPKRYVSSTIFGIAVCFLSKFHSSWSQFFFDNCHWRNTKGCHGVSRDVIMTLDSGLESTYLFNYSILTVQSSLLQSRSWRCDNPSIGVRDSDAKVSLEKSDVNSP